MDIYRLTFYLAPSTAVTNAAALTSLEGAINSD